MIFGLYLCLEIRQKAISKHRDYQYNETDELKFLLFSLLHFWIEILKQDDTDRNDDAYNDLFTLKFKFFIIDSGAEYRNQYNRQNVTRLGSDDNGITGPLYGIVERDSSE